MFTQRRLSIWNRFPQLVLTFWLAASAMAQQPSSATAPAEQQTTPGVAVDSARKTVDLPGYSTTEQNEGSTLGQYEVRQSIEFGGRISNFSGNPGMWSSYVNLFSGPRLLEQTLDMHSADHTGWRGHNARGDGRNEWKFRRDWRSCTL